MILLRDLSRRLRRRHSAPALLGGIESVSPSLMSGWVYHPLHPLVEVRLLVGPHLIAQARVEELRPDVVQHLGVDGMFGFRLSVPVLPFPLPGREPPRLVALTADAGERFDLGLVAQSQPITPLLQAALRQELRGLHGHVDGLTPDGTALHGWCTREGSTTPARVWLQSEGIKPLELHCDVVRPGMTAQGLPDACGFRLDLSEWPGLAGRSVLISYDQEGLLPIPSANSQPLWLPEIKASADPLPATTRDGAGHLSALASMPMRLNATEELDSSINNLGTATDLQVHWDLLEQVRREFDRIELGIQQAKQADQLGADFFSRRRRSARFRLWR